MTTATEASFAKTPLASDLAAGVESLDLEQEITFTRYVRLVLPADGFVFWVKASIVSPSALANACLPNRVAPNQGQKILTVAPTLIAKGSLHYATDVRQEASQTYAAERMVFTAEEPVNDLSAIAPNTLWIGVFQGKRFAFSSRSSFYQQADLFHYVGFAVYPDMETQIIDNPAGFDPNSRVVSNSLPAWLALNGYVTPYGFGNPSLPLYPSFLVPENIAPPFAAVDIPPGYTRALTSAPHISRKTSSHSQLCADTVTITLWGIRNDQALDFVDCVYQYSANYGVIGIMNLPVIRDEKRTQSELGTIAMKKSVDFEVSYHQNRMNSIARQVIKSCIPNIYIDGAA
jgi:hypothetical protein